ncbi:MAG: TonB-dependent receptor [Sphingobacteriales bacterium]|nr:TonB-dependent receptor [Sphingobacteriales bacterium]
MRLSKIFSLLLIFIFFGSLNVIGQITTGSITGIIKDSKGGELAGATVEAVHVPSGSVYRSVSTKNGRFNLPGLRVGGPYTVSITFVGLKKEEYKEIYVQLGEATKIDVVLVEEGKSLQEIVVTGSGRGRSLISKDRKGTSTNVNRRLLATLPTLSRNLTDFTKLTPQSNGTSFAGQDNRLINLTLDGSIFNNSFGLQPLNGSQTNSTPISLDAIEEIQINLSPYNLKDAGFTGASINAVTRSGTNTFHGIAFYNERNQNLVGTKAGLGGKTPLTIADFKVQQYGASFGGPIIKNKLFFFANFEAEKRVDPADLFKADDGTNTGKTNVTRVKKADLDGLRDFLVNKLGYDPGVYDGYSFITRSYKTLLRLDWNINSKNKFNLRFNSLRGYREVPVSTSGTVSGSRRDNLFAMNFSNNNYEQNNDIYSVIGQLNTRLGNKLSNELTFGWTANRDYRNVKGKLFPGVDIQDGSGASATTYIAFGSEPFTPNNKLFTDTWQLSDNLTMYAGKHTISTGINFESFRYFNSFTPQIQGYYTFSSLADFYTSANAYVANPNMAQNPVNVRRYTLNYSNLQGGIPWNAVTRPTNIGAYVQDEVSVNDKLNFTYGIRFDVPFFAKTGFVNTEVDNLNFVDDNGSTIKLSTSQMPSAKLMVSPRFGYNYDAFGDKRTQIRGGFGFFAGRPPFVFISNQIGNNGVQSGNIQTDNTKLYPFSPDVTRNVPTNIVPGTPAVSYNVATTQKNFRFPQVFRTNIAVDQKLFWGIVGTAEFMFTQNISYYHYYNANFKPATTTFNGPDKRPKFAGSAAAQRINSKITDATVLSSRPWGQNLSATVKIEKPLSKGLSWMVAYNFGRARDYESAATIASSSWTGIRSVNGNNLPDLAFSDNDIRHRVIGNINYRFEVAKTAALQFSLFVQSQNQGRVSYSYQGDMNGDGISGNDLMYIPKDQSEMNFEQFTSSGTTFTVQQQKDAYEAYIQQDAYLKNHRGQYAARNGVLLPMLTRMDFSTALDLFRQVGKNRHTLQFRIDIFNVGNMIKHNWGISDIVNTTNPVVFSKVDANNVPVFRMNRINNSINFTTYRKGTLINDVWQAQFGFRYIF